MRALVFDLDGTLADSTRAITATWELVLTEAGLPTGVTAGLPALIGLPLTLCFDRLLPELPTDERAALVERYRQTYGAMAEREERLFPGVEALLQETRAAGFALGVATGKSQSGAENAVRRHGLDGAFDSVHGILPGTPGKPDPAVLSRALEALGRGAERTMMIGDTLYDLSMAQALGVPFCGVSWGVHRREDLLAAGAERMCDTVEELTEVVLGGW